MRAILILTALAACLSSGRAQSDDDFIPKPHQVFLAQLAGEWAGVFSYRETESRRTVQVPVAVTARTPSDGSYVVMETTYLDPDLRIFSARMITSDGERVRESYIRDGELRTTDFEIERIAVSRGGERVDVRMITTDDSVERPSEIRVSYIFDRGTLVRRTDVRFLNAQEAPFQLRDEVRLARTAVNPPRAPGDPAAAAGRR